MGDFENELNKFFFKRKSKNKMILLNSKLYSCYKIIS